MPLSGFPSRFLYFAPRVGFAYDLFGSGKTVLRGGWGRFNFHTAQFTNGLDVSAGVRAYTFQNSTTLRDIENYNPGTGDRLGAAAVDRFSDRTPFSDSYSMTISQRLWGSSLLELSYVGNRSDNLLCNTGACANVNPVPAGALLQPGVGDPNNPAGGYDSYRPIAGFQDLNITTHGLYQNYNSFQVSWLRTKGRYNINLNYTFGKSLGIVNSGYDTFNLRNNYGVMPNNRTHLFNAAYSIELGNPVKNNKFAAGFVNGWQLSGISQIQSGVNLTGNTGYNFNLDAGGYVSPVTGWSVNSRSINGTDSIALRPQLTCDPGSNLGDKQFVNGACFSLPLAPGQNGPTVMAPFYGPMFMNHDLGLFKNFQMGESRKLQLRFNAYNFLNHPLDTFITGSNNMKLIYGQTTGQMTNPVFGTTTEKQGKRIIQVAVKFYF